MKGSVTIVMMLLTLFVAPIALASLYFITTLFINLKSPNKTILSTIEERAVYKRKSLIAGIAMLAVGFLSVAGASLIRTGSNTAIDFILTPIMIALVPFAILCIVRGFIYVSRANTVDKYLVR